MPTLPRGTRTPSFLAPAARVPNTPDAPAATAGAGREAQEIAPAQLFVFFHDNFPFLVPGHLPDYRLHAFGEALNFSTAITGLSARSNLSVTKARRRMSSARALPMAAMIMP